MGKRMGKWMCKSLGRWEMSWLIEGKRNAKEAGPETVGRYNCRASGY